MTYNRKKQYPISKQTQKRRDYVLNFFKENPFGLLSCGHLHEFCPELFHHKKTDANNVFSRLIRTGHLEALKKPQIKAPVKFRIGVVNYFCLAENVEYFTKEAAKIECEHNMQTHPHRYTGRHGVTLARSCALF
jgi:hypothetical protein